MPITPHITQYTPLDVVELEINNPIEVIQDHFGNSPLAFVWPGGNFTAQAAADGLWMPAMRLVLLSYSRGPLMYNWIPLGRS